VESAIIQRYGCAINKLLNGNGGPWNKAMIVWGYAQETATLIENVLGNIESQVKLLVVNPFGSIKILRLRHRQHALHQTSHKLI
jgi:hypothetical protein